MKSRVQFATEEKKELWPDLPLYKWEATYNTIHLWTQIIGKLKLQHTLFKNHWWNVVFFPTLSGLTTGIIPYGNNCFAIDFDFVEHQLNISRLNGKKDSFPLSGGTIADFYFLVKERLEFMGIEFKIWPVPVEMDDRLRFDMDNRPREYDPEYAGKFLKVLDQSCKTLDMFRTSFSGKASPVHFFWGSFDLAVTFFSGKPAPEHPGAANVGKEVMVKAYNAELASFGFWPGKGLGEPAYYAYAYPFPKDYQNYPVKIKGAYYHRGLREFILPYSTVTENEIPEKLICDFCHNAYRAAEELAKWERHLFKNNS